jgi:hypothetical protein
MIGTPEAWQLPRMPPVPASRPPRPSDHPERPGPYRGNRSSPRAPAPLPVPNAPTACPCRATLRWPPPSALAARAPSPGTAAPEASRTAAPSPSRSRFGIRNGPLRPTSARPSAQACAIWASVLAPRRRNPPHPGRRRSRRNPSRSGRHAPSADPLQDQGRFLWHIARSDRPPARPNRRPRGILGRGMDHRQRHARPRLLADPGQVRQPDRGVDAVALAQPPPPRCTTAWPSASPSIAATKPSSSAGTSITTGAEGSRSGQRSTKSAGPPCAATMRPKIRPPRPIAARGNPAFAAIRVRRQPGQRQRLAPKATVSPTRRC